MALYVLPYFVFRRLNLVLQQSTYNRIKVANHAKHARNSGALHLSVGDEKHEHLCLLVVEAVELKDAVHKTRVGVAHASIDASMMTNVTTGSKEIAMEGVRGFSAMGLFTSFVIYHG